MGNALLPIFSTQSRVAKGPSASSLLALSECLVAVTGVNMTIWNTTTKEW
jgi:hypothetical protein